MTRDEIKAALAEEMGRIAPEVEFDDVDPDDDLRDAFEIDSMDFLTLMTALHKRLGVSIPEADYGRMGSVNRATAYLAERLGAGD